MVEDTMTPDDHGPSCPWCSTPVPSLDAAICPGCGANLHGDDLEDEVPGVTAIHPEIAALLTRAERSAQPPPRRGLLGWLSADEDADSASPIVEASEGALDRPSGAVRREMLRLEMEALLLEVGAAGPAEAVAEEPPDAPDSRDDADPDLGPDAVAPPG